MASSSGDRSQRASSAAVEDLKPFIEINKDDRGIPEVLLVSPRGAAVRVSLHGGQVRSWRNEKGEELLFTSSKAIYKPPAAVREEFLFVFHRNRMWVVDENPPPIQSFDSSCRTFIDLLLKSSDEDLKHWPHSFELRLRVLLTFEGHLILISRVRNVNCKPFSFSFSFHTYFSVSDISEVRVEGLETLDYLDNLRNRERFTEQGDALTFESEVDRAYLSSSDAVAVFDHEKKRTFVIKKEGLPDVVVWNPWDKRAKAIPDFGDDEYRRMLCVDAACIEKQIPLKPGEEWTGRVELSARALDNMMMHDKAKGFQVKEQAETNMTNSILLHPEVALFLCHLNNNNTQLIIKSHFAVFCENGCYILIAMILVFVLYDSWNWYMILNSAKVLNLNCEVV
ncbi:UNVERIFIED_CONTAM: putative glucose-6-phosphate 1-epimerase [Sesamum calycinum]|uniref:glucose-6-phosphate 1-epimerase n=1 Tax=Sesamum calycinum TaxID=2727403 RepID=A0AAW2M0P5_9LAMI